MARAGFDWVCIDTQHGMIGYEQMLHMLQGLAAARTPALVRVARNDSGEIGRALDAGASGVVVPMVNSAADAAAVVKACRYPPLGARSWAKSTRAGVSWPGYNPTDANTAILSIVQVETRESVAQLHSILSVDGIDGVFVGPGDLAVSLGFNPREKHPPELGEMTETILQACLARGIVAGIACPSIEVGLESRARGFRALAIQNDVSLLSQAASRVVGALAPSRSAG